MKLPADVDEAIRWARMSLDRVQSPVDKAAIRRYIDRLLDTAGLTK